MKLSTFLFSLLILIMISGTPAAASDLESSISELAKEISEQMEKYEAKKMAVAGFTDLNGYKSALGDFISEELITNLVNTGKFEIIERRELDRVLREHEMYAEGVFDKNTIAELQKLLGIDALITGSITNLGEYVKINSRSISVETGRIFAAASVKVDINPMVEQLLGQRARNETSGGLSRPSSRGGGFGTQRSDVSFKNSFIQVLPTGISLSKDGHTLKVSLEFRNLTSDPQFLALTVSNWGVLNTDVISDAGDEFPVGQRGQGLRAATGLRKVSGQGYEKESDFTVIDGNSVAVVILKFVVPERSDPIKGREFSISAELVRFVKGRHVYFSIGLSGLQLNQ